MNNECSPNFQSFWKYLFSKDVFVRKINLFFGFLLLHIIHTILNNIYLNIGLYTSGAYILQEDMLLKVIQA